MEHVVDNGLELVGNVRVAADHLQTQHREALESRNKALETLLAQEDAESQAAVEVIAGKWPSTDRKRTGGIPSDLFAQILSQKESCNSLLEQKNDLISVLEEEVRNCDDQYKLLVDEYHENVTVLATRMEEQIQTLEAMIVAERAKLEGSSDRQLKDDVEGREEIWQNQLRQLNELSESQMEKRLQLLVDNENELDAMVTREAEEFVDMKHTLEESIGGLSDQIQFFDSVHQLNEERLDYEIHVLRKHEEEVVLVKSEQKRKITSLQDGINKLRQKVHQANKNVSKEEAHLHAAVDDIGNKIQKLDELKKNHAKFARKKKEDILYMVRSETLDKLETMLDFDHQLKAIFVNSGAKKLDVYLDPLLGLDYRRNSQSSSRGTLESAAVALKNRDAPEEDDFDSTTDDMKLFLNKLIEKGNFLVEENLNVLVEADDITEREKNLFRLDSILAAIGIEDEDEIWSVLRKQGKNSDIIKFIRAHIEQKQQQQQQGTASASSSSSMMSNAEASSPSTSATSSISTSAGRDQYKRQWEAMIVSVSQLFSQENQTLLKELQNLCAIQKSTSQLEDENWRMKRQLKELNEIASKLAGLEVRP